ncbi:hypothetical protein [Streptomyces albireticuli]|uniref:hypothetical protein n=1 Tax=Streptomyces albireticuli TaxID=1940 RepID=UPI00117BE528|nr:hypothetical protein [Streptomyces albireticuli]MCD9144340.1 hypothetical protein [Streptomyces albireticuli]MCD9162017.1 hypothetical protein [Streptomyces albireticuli]MCD9193977.1 hypothetical protein [Streptomyces albireticuli]
MTAPTPAPYQPRWCAQLLQVEEAALVRLYVLPGEERARLRVEPRWYPCVVSGPWNVAEAR